MRVSQCCCGCSLKTGTLILLWLDLLSQAYTVIKLAVAACTTQVHFTFFDSAILGWGCIVLVILIYGLVGVDKHRPSYLLPYIGVFVFRLACLALFTLILWVGSLAIRDNIMDMIQNQASMSGTSQKVPEKDLRKAYDTAVAMATFVLIFIFALDAYFLTVVYSYYKQMQEEDKGIFNPASGTGIVYAAPTEHPPAYGLQPAASPYAQQNVGYPQPVPGYPPQQPAGYPQQQFPNYPQKQ